MLFNILIIALATALPKPQSQPVKSFFGAEWAIYRDSNQCSAEFVSPEQQGVRVQIQQRAGQAATVQLDFPRIEYRGKQPEKTSIAFHRFQIAQKLPNDRPTLIVPNVQWEHGNGRSKAKIGDEAIAVQPLARDIRIIDQRRRMVGHAIVPSIEDASRWVGNCAAWTVRDQPGSGKAAVTSSKVKSPSPNRPLQYPWRALFEGRTGETVVRATISAIGRVSACDIVQSSRYMDLDLAACQAISTLEFDPAVDEDGKPTLSEVIRKTVWAIE